MMNIKNKIYLKGFQNFLSWSKWKLLLVVVILATTLFPNSTAASAPIFIHMNGQQLSVPNNLTIIQNGRVYVPISFISNSMGANVKWNHQRKIVNISQSNNQVELRIGQQVYVHNMVRKGMDVAPFIRQSRTMVPIRFVADSLNLHVHWDANRRTVFLQTNHQPAEQISEELYWLARIIASEARGESLQGQIAVGAVVLNRVKSSQFPNSVFDVVFERFQQIYQFEPVLNGEIFRVQPNEQNITAARRALAGEDPTNGAMFFHNPAISNSAWMNAKPVAIRIGNHTFLY